MKGMLLETITTGASAKSHFIDVSLVYWKTFAHLQAESIIGAAKLLSRQHGTNKNERATSGALMAVPFS
jgi:predicted lipoprotein with Yx(FWY)xxD motif